MPWGVAAAAIGVAGTVYASNKSSKAAESAAEGEGAASAEAIARSQEAFSQTEAELTPYARQEQAASTQLMAQMGLAPPSGGGGQGMGTGGDSWGFGAAPKSTGGAASGAAGREGGEFQRFMEDMLGDQMAIATRAGYSRDKAASEAARRAEGFLQSLKQSGDLPADFTTPSLSDLTAAVHTMGADNQYNFKSYGRNADGSMTQGTGPQSLEAVKGRLQTHGGAETLLPQYFEQQGQENIVGVNADGTPKMGIPTPAGGTAQMGGPGGMPDQGAGPQRMGASDVMGLAGMEAMPEEVREEYLAGVMEDPRSDPELAGYLGLTEESMQVGSGYQDTPAYMAAREAGIEAVDQGAAGGGTLYSGARGEALRDVGQGVEQEYYMDAMNRRESMMGARRGEYGARQGRVAGAYNTGRQEQQSYYNNYMQLLSGMSAPTTTTNIGSMRQGAATGQGATALSTARNIGDLKMGAAANQGAAATDIAGGIMKMGGAYIGRPQ